MKQILALTLVAALVGICGPAQAAKSWEDMSWWGNTGATPDPVKDTTRSGSWWWPITPKSNENDGELWGNRGIVYHIYEVAQVVEDKKPPEEPKPKTPAPVTPEVKRQAIALSSVLFGFDQSTLTPIGKAEIDKLVAEMKAHGKDTVVIEGHTCDIGEADYNKALGQRRADAVKAYMVENGIDAGRISTVSYGEEKPAVPNDSSENRKLNRRAVFDITVVLP